MLGREELEEFHRVGEIGSKQIESERHLKQRRGEGAPGTGNRFVARNHGFQVWGVMSQCPKVRNWRVQVGLHIRMKYQTLPGHVFHMVQWIDVGSPVRPRRNGTLDTGRLVRNGLEETGSLTLANKRAPM